MTYKDTVEELKEAVKDLDVNNKEDVKEEVYEHNYDENEQKAMSLGWKPEGKKNAKQWLEDYPLLKEINKLSKENKDLATLLETYINDQNSKETRKQEQELKTMRTEAIRMGDVELVDKIDKHKDDLKVTRQQPQVDPIFADFFNKYPQIIDPKTPEEIEMRMYFNQVDSLLGNRLDPREHMNRLEAAIVHKFATQLNIDSDEVLTSSVESGIQSNVKKTLRKKYTEHDLSPEQRDTFKNFQKYKISITLDKYIEKLVAQGDLK